MFGKGKARWDAGEDDGRKNAGPGSGGAPGTGGGDFDNLVLDETFVKSATVKEESARTRQLREEWKKEPPKAQPWRSYEGDALQHRMAELNRQVAGERARAAETAKAKQAAWASDRPTPKRGKLRVVRKSIAPIVVFALVVGVYLFYSHRTVPAGNAAVPQINPSLTAMPSAVDVRASVTPTGSCYPGVPGCGSPSQPYAGSPSVTWADGDAGIVLPAAAKTADFSAAQVAAALALSKQFLIDQTLVPDVLVGGAKPTAMSDLITQSNSYRSLLTQRLASPTSSSDPSWLVVRFDPKNTALLTTPKVSGTITYAQEKAGVLEVNLSFKIVYALQKPDKTTWTRTMATVDDELRFYNGTHDYEPTTGTVWPGPAGITSYAGAECNSKDGFQEPWYVMDEPDGPDPAATVVDPYSTATAAPNPSANPTAETCTSVSRL